MVRRSLEGVALSDVVRHPEETVSPPDRSTVSYAPADPYPEWARKRRQGCPYREDSAEDEPVTFSILTREHARICLEHPDVGLADVYAEHLREIMGEGMHTLDPPAHTHRRAKLKPLFQEAASTLTADELERHAGRVFTAFEDRERIDLMEEYASVVPFHVVSELLGLPASHRAWFRRAVRGFSRAFQQMQIDGSKGKLLRRSRDEIREYFRRMIQAARERTGDDGLLMKLAHFKEGGERLPVGTILGFLMHLAPASTDSTATATGMTLHALLHHRRQHEKLRDDLSRVPGAVEEGLRWEPPFAVLDRRVEEPFELGGRELPKGARLLVHVGAANRDPEVFERPDVFDVEREPGRHLTFAAGPHLCLGRTLARREMQAMLRVLYGNLEDFRLDSERSDEAYVGGTYWRSIPALPVVLS